MSRKRPGWRSGERTYRSLSLDLARRGLEEKYQPLRAAARLALLELEQLHAHHYPRCAGGCPAEEATSALRSALERK